MFTKGINTSYKYMCLLHEHLFFPPLAWRIYCGSGQQQQLNGDDRHACASGHTSH